MVSSAENLPFARLILTSRKSIYSASYQEYEEDERKDTFHLLEFIEGAFAFLK